MTEVVFHLADAAMLLAAGYIVAAVAHVVASRRRRAKEDRAKREP